MPDFAVGAPYDDKGKGKVYIYYGSATGQISPKASQVHNKHLISIFLLSCYAC